MNLQRLAILAFATFVSVATFGQLFHPLGLGIEKCGREEKNFRPQMHIEGDILYACTNQGLYSKDLSDDESTWQLVGFEGISLQDFVRRSDDLLAMRYNISNHYFLLSHDGGNTYEDVTPDKFYMGEAASIMTLTRLVQHPTDPNTLLVLSDPWGIYHSPDFGQTWNRLTYEIIPEYIGYHPLNPKIIYASGEDEYFSWVLNISYDSGLTWQYNPPYSSGDNCVNRIAFHPTDPDRWIVGGSGVDNSDIVYMAGRTSDKIEIMCSTDGGKTWSVPQTEPMKKSSTENVYDLKQYGSKLLFYTESDIYEISKAELLAQATAVHGITTATTEDSPEIYDLQGRRLSTTPQKGVYIQNGKKKLVK